MTTLTHHLRKQLTALRNRGTDRGAAITSLVVVMMVAMFLVVGLTVDGGMHVRGITRAERVATEAARAGLQYYRSNGVPDPRGAVTAAQNYLASAGTVGSLTGTAELIDGDTLQVNVTVRTPTYFLGILGIDDLSSSGSGTADLVAIT